MTHFHVGSIPTISTSVYIIHILPYSVLRILTDWRFYGRRNRDQKMYQSLQSIGLKTYLDGYFFNGQYLHEKWLKRLDYFVSCLSEEQKVILKKKFQKNLPHLSKNDLLHELMVACAYYPQAQFNGASGADLINGEISIEVKTINASPTEVERIKNLIPDSTRTSIPEDIDFEKRFENKFQVRARKAVEQLKHVGILVIVWDSDLVVGWEGRKKKIETLLNRLAENNKRSELNVEIKTVFFGDLREMLSQ